MMKFIHHKTDKTDNEYRSRVWTVYLQTPIKKIRKCNFEPPNSPLGTPMSQPGTILGRFRGGIISQS